MNNFIDIKGYIIKVESILDVQYNDNEIRILRKNPISEDNPEEKSTTILTIIPYELNEKIQMGNDIEVIKNALQVLNRTNPNYVSLSKNKYIFTNCNTRAIIEIDSIEYVSFREKGRNNTNSGKSEIVFYVKRQGEKFSSYSCVYNDDKIWEKDTQMVSEILKARKMGV